MNVLELNCVNKRFGSREVLKGLSFVVPEHTQGYPLFSSITRA